MRRRIPPVPSPPQSCEDPKDSGPCGRASPQPTAAVEKRREPPRRPNYPQDIAMPHNDHIATATPEARQQRPTASPRRNHILNGVKHAENTYSPKPRRHIYAKYCIHKTKYRSKRQQQSIPSNGQFAQATGLRQLGRRTQGNARHDAGWQNALSSRRGPPFNTLAKPGEVGRARGNQPLEWAGGLERSIRGAAPSRHLREPDSPAPPPWMDNPEEAGVGRWRRAPLCREAVGSHTECGGAIGGDMYKAAVEYVTLLCRKREEPPRGRRTLP